MSWEDKSWVVGIQVDRISRVYDWNLLKKRRLIHDRISQTPVLLVVSKDGRSFSAFERNAPSDMFSIRNDTLYTDRFTDQFR